MRLKIFKSFFVTTACILFVTLTLLFVIMSFAVNGYISDTRNDQLTKAVDAVSKLVLSDAADDEILTNIETVADINELDIFVSDDKGDIFLCSCIEFSKAGACEHSAIPLDKAYLSEIGDDVQFGLNTMKGRYDDFKYVSSRRLIRGGEAVYIFSAATTVTVTEMLKVMLHIYAISAIIPLLLMFFAEYILTYRLTKPLKYMSVAARSIAKGDFSNRIPVMSDDEIGELSVLFNKMSASLSKTEMGRRNFISNVSHELKTPMTTISGFIDGIIDGTIDESKHNYYLKIVSDEVKRLSRLVQSMLSIARLESDEHTVNPSEFDLAELILSVVVSMEQRITEKNLSVEGLEELSHTFINADKDLIYQVVYNLVDNAVKYSADSGYIKFASHRIGDKLEFSIRNDGVGIPPADIPHVFERFYKTDKSRSGNKDSLGLGLYITKTIVDLHDGDISVSSEKDKFTEFKVSVPVNKVRNK